MDFGEETVVIHGSSGLGAHYDRILFRIDALAAIQPNRLFLHTVNGTCRILHCCRHVGSVHRVGAERGFTIAI